jgi:serine/threonine protein kinase
MAIIANRYQLNKSMDKNDDHHLLRLKDTFIHRQHLCLVFELLSVNLYELIKQNQFRGLSTTLVRVFAQQLLTGLALLSKAKLIHCDLKPENILLKKYVPVWCAGGANGAVLRAPSLRSSTLDRPATNGRRCTHTSSHGSIARRKSCLACRR